MTKRYVLLIVSMFCVLCIFAETYISDIKVGGGSKDKTTSYNNAARGGYTVIDRDLNEKAGGCYVYLSYKLTSDPSKAITDVIIVTGKEFSNKKYLTTPIKYEGMDYYLCPYEDENSDLGDLNDGAGGSYIFVFYSRDENNSKVKGLSITTSSKKSVRGYNGSSSLTSVNLNEGTEGTALYLNATRSECVFHKFLNCKCRDCGYVEHTFENNNEYICTVCGHAFIYYESQGYGIVEPNVEKPFGDAKIISNKYDFEYGGVIELDRLPTTIGNDAFDKISHLFEIYIPNSVVSIGSNAFSNTGLYSIDIPNSVVSIGSNAFSNTDLFSIDIPNSVRKIGSGIFLNCSSLESVSLPNSLNEIPSSAFRNCTSLKSIKIPDSVTCIGAEAFEGCSMLVEVVFTNNIKTIEMAAFMDCTKLTEVVIPNSVVTIERYSFAGCTRLSHVVVPNTLKSIEESAFYDCEYLTNFTIPDSVTSIGDYFITGWYKKPITIVCEASTPPTITTEALCEVSYGLTIYVPLGSVEEYKKAEGWKDYASSIFVKDSSIQGDLNGDCNVDIADVVCLVEMLRKPLSDTNGMADVNKDGVTNLNDLKYVVDVILNR
ncbi:MAG: leucine-rich repeat protein [Bacteroidaceae bacterium]|nr:leucine-rich repeat protein [Bacteroidaceae bacterium]